VKCHKTVKQKLATKICLKNRVVIWPNWSDSAFFETVCQKYYGLAIWPFSMGKKKVSFKSFLAINPDIFMKL
jgi:hypothetical protein